MTIDLTFDKLPYSEQRDFLATLQRHRLLFDDFDVTWRKGYQSTENAPVATYVTVACRSCRTWKRFRAHAINDWVRDFDDAIRRGEFASA